MKLIVSLVVLAAFLGLGGMYVGFTSHFTFEMGRLGWELVSKIF